MNWIYMYQRIQGRYNLMELNGNFDLHVHNNSSCWAKWLELRTHNCNCTNCVCTSLLCMQFAFHRMRVFKVTSIMNDNFHCSISTRRILVLGKFIFGAWSGRSRCHWPTVCAVRIYFKMYPVSWHHTGKCLILIMY